MRVRCLSILSLITFLSAATLAQNQAPAPDSPDAMKQQLDRLQRRMQDWPQLSRYKDANTKVPMAEKNENRVVFMGD